MSYDEEADWSIRGEDMKTKHKVSPWEANEALRDPFRVVISPDPSSLSGKGIRVIGRTTAGRMLTVIVMDLNGVLYGVNGWSSNRTDGRRYSDRGRGYGE
jgi:hypothetical protein